MNVNSVERTLVGFLTAGVWALVVLVGTSISSAQDPVDESADAQTGVLVIHANEIVGLSAFVQQSVRDHQYRPQSMPGLDQHIRSIVRNCRISGSVSGGRLSATAISC